VPLGGRVPTRNPRRWEYDDSLPEPDEATWAKLSLTVQRNDGGLVDAELLRPRAWIELHGLRAGELLPLHLAELEVSGPALVTAIEACPPIASGAGSVVTARFVTREVHRLVSIDLLGAGGELETLTGTPVHPVWSLDRGDWVPLAELSEGETLQGHTGPAIVLHLSLHQAAQPVYNLEVHGEHVYQVGELGVLVHNAGEECELLQRTTVKSSLRPAIRKNDLANFQDFKNRSVIGDNLEGHELLQHAWLKEHGYARIRLGTDVSKGNPVIALKRQTHQTVNSAQSGINVVNQTAVDNILANRRIMLEQGLSRTRVNRLTIKALWHALENGL
jgi:hypothetical protein